MTESICSDELGTIDLLPWYLVYTKPRQEERALENLQRQNYSVYLPKYRKFKNGNNKKNDESYIVEPLFPRYLFVQTKHEQQSLTPIQSTRGVVSIVRFGGRLASIPHTLIEEIKLIEEYHNDSKHSQHNLLAPGTRVQIGQYGIFQGFEGIVERSSAKRVTVLMEILGGLNRITVKRTEIDILDRD